MIYFKCIFLDWNLVPLAVQSLPYPRFSVLPDVITLGMLLSVNLCVGDGPWHPEKETQLRCSVPVLESARQTYRNVN